MEPPSRQPDDKPGSRSTAARQAHQRLRERIERDGFNGYVGREAYYAYMRWLRSRSLAKHPDLASLGGKAHHAQYAANDPAGYRNRQRGSYDAACKKHGTSKVKDAITKAHERQRRWRLDNPTPAEAALRAQLAGLGFTIHRHDDAPFDYLRYLREGGELYGPLDVVIEAKVVPYFVDALIVALHLSIEAIGGVHEAFRADHDAKRAAFFARIGLVELALPNAEILAGPDALCRALSRYDRPDQQAA